MRFRKELYGFSVAAITFLIFIPALQNGFVNWDDPGYVYENTQIRHMGLDFLKWVATGVVHSHWHPLTMISYAFDYSIWQLNPLGYHLTNNLLHTLNTFLVFLIAYDLLTWPGSISNRAVYASALVSLLFGIHPLRVESVAWISERKDVLYAFFFLLSVYTYIRYVSAGERKKIFYLALIPLFVLSLLSKSMAVTLPVILLLLDYYPMERMRAKGFSYLLKEKMPLFATSILISAIALWSQHQGGAISSLESIPLYDRIIVAVTGYIFYLIKIVFPLELVPFYPYPKDISLFSVNFYVPVAIFFFITALAIIWRRKNRLFFTSWFYYLVTLLPVIGFIQVGKQSAADRYTYLSSLGPFSLFSVSCMFHYLKASDNARRVSMFILLITVLTLGAKTVKQVYVWKDSISLWDHQIAIYPNRYPDAYVNRGNYYVFLQDYQHAINDYSTAIWFNSSDAKVFSNRGNVFGLIGNHSQAIKDYNEAIRLTPDDPVNYNNRGNSRRLMGDYAGAIQDFRKAVEINPSYAKAFYNMSLAYSDMGDKYRAAYALKVAISLEKKDAERKLYMEDYVRLMTEK